MARWRQAVFILRAQHRGEQAQRLGAAAVGQAAILDRLGQGFGLARQDQRSAVQRFLRQSDLQAISTARSSRGA